MGGSYRPPDARGRRHPSAAWLKAGRQAREGRNTIPRGQKLVVQMVETFREHMAPAFVERLDAWQLAEQTGMAIPPVMIYGDDVSHILTEEGIANLLLCRSDEEREQAIRGVAGYTPVGMGRDKRMVENLRDRGIIQRAEDLGIDKRLATRDLLAAKNMKGLVRASGGLYEPPKRFRNWYAALVNPIGKDKIWKRFNSDSNRARARWPACRSWWAWSARAIWRC